MCTRNYNWVDNVKTEVRPAHIFNMRTKLMVTSAERNFAQVPTSSSAIILREHAGQIEILVVFDSVN